MASLGTPRDGPGCADRQVDLLARPHTPATLHRPLPPASDVLRKDPRADAGGQRAANQDASDATFHSITMTFDPKFLTAGGVSGRQCPQPEASARDDCTPPSVDGIAKANSELLKTKIYCAGDRPQRNVFPPMKSENAMWMIGEQK